MTQIGSGSSINAVVGTDVSDGAALAALSQRSGQNDSLGIIIPPPDIRSIVDKTAQFVAKNGPEFEKRVLLDKGSERKFSFLLPGNPYKPYYDAKVKENLTGEVSEGAKPQVPHAIVELKKREQEKQKKRENLLALTSYAVGSLSSNTEGLGELLKLTDFGSIQPSSDGRLLAIDDGRPPEPVADDRFTATRPFAAALDIDVIKLTAQYVARNGQRFLVGLSQRERGNAQFSFLRATHPLFSYFTTLADAYTRCLLPDKAMLSRLKEDIGISGRFSSLIESEAPFVRASDVLNGPQNFHQYQMNCVLSIFERVVARQRWDEYETKRKQDKAREEAEEREQMHALDWHEFVVVEVIQFTDEDELLPLLPPIELSQLTKPAMIAPLTHSLGIHSASSTDVQQNQIANEDSAALGGSYFINSNLKEPHQTPLNVVQSSHQLLTSMPVVQHQDGFSDAPPEVNASTATPIMIVSDYVRQPKKRNRQLEKMMKCPITGQLVPAEQMTEHLRILLLDPKWKEEKDALIAKAQKGSAFAVEGDFETNLANFVVKRPDLFGSVDEECESAYVPVPKR